MAPHNPTNRISVLCPMFLVERMENTFARLGRVKGTPVIFAKYATLAVQESTMVRCGGGGVASTFTLAAPPPSTHPPVNLQSSTLAFNLSHSLIPPPPRHNSTTKTFTASTPPTAITITHHTYCLMFILFIIYIVLPLICWMDALRNFH